LLYFFENIAGLADSKAAQCMVKGCFVCVRLCVYLHMCIYICTYITWPDWTHL